MKTLPLILTLTIAAFFSVKAQVPDSEQPLQIAGKITLLDPSGHHIGVETDKHQPMMFVFDTSLSIIDEANKALDINTLQVGMPVNIYYTDLTTVGRLLASKLIVYPMPLKTPASTPAAAPAPNTP